MLNVIASERLRSQYEDVLNRIFVMSLGNMSHDLRAIFVSLKESRESASASALLVCEIDVTPNDGDSFTISAEGEDALWAIEHCFFRARRALRRRKSQVGMRAV